MTITQNVRHIARRAGLSRSQVTAIADDLGIQMHYRLADRPILEITNRNEAALLIDHLHHNS